jgi:colicin import membrane protein
LQYPQNNNPYKFPSDKGKGIFGTALIHLVFLALLILVSFSVPPQTDNDDGIMVNFGTDETGFGMIEPSPPAFQEMSALPTFQEEASPPAESKSAAEKKEAPLLTQNNEEAPAVKKVDPEAEAKKLEKAEADKKLRKQREIENELKKQADIEKKRVEAEQQRQSDIMNRTKNALANSRNSGTNSTSEGIAGGPGNQGSLNGSVDSKVRGEGGGTGTSGNGISYNLGGRGVQKLPSPKYDYQGEGIVVVEVSVDRSGKVIQATPGVKGSSALDEYLLKVAKDAALEATFVVKQDAPLIQKGTITYNFKLK